MEESQRSSCTQKGDKQLLKNYRPISLLPIFGKNFEIIKLNQYEILENLLCLIKCLLINRKQRVVVNVQTSSWTNILAGVPQRSILGPLCFFIYINDPSDDLSSNPKLFADDTSLFSVVHDKNTSAKELNNDLRKISNWAYQWKMSFNPDPLKQAQEVIFSRKMTKTNHPTLVFNENPVHQVALHKHLGMYLDCKLNFEEHLKTIINKIIKTIGLLRKFQNFLPRKSLLTIYKSFIRPHFDYGDIIYDQTYNTSFHQRLESLQYNAALAITGAIRGTLKEKLYNELGLESLQNRQWY